MECINESVDIQILKQQNQILRLAAKGICHEMRNHFAKVSLVADSLSENLIQSNEKQLKQISEGLKNSVASTELFLKMMQLRINPEKAINPKLTQLSIGAVVDKALSQYAVRMQDKSRIRVAMQNDFTFQGDQTLIEHVLFNLFTNALEAIAMNPEGEVIVTTSSGSGQNTLIIQDNGIGISKQALGMIFDIGYSTKTYGDGTGLALCQYLIEQMNGIITCQSKEAEYTVFRLAFPQTTTP